MPAASEESNILVSSLRVGTLLYSITGRPTMFTRVGHPDKSGGCPRHNLTRGQLRFNAKKVAEFCKRRTKVRRSFGFDKHVARQPLMVHPRS